MADELEALDAFIAARQPLIVEFDTIVRAALGDDPECADIRIGAIVYDLAAGTIRPSMARLPRGRQADPRGKHYWMPDRPTLVRLAGRTIEMRSRRFDPAIGAVTLPPDDWRERMREAAPYNFACEMSCYSGWADLIEAYVRVRIDSGDPPIFTQVKEKLGALRLYESGDFRDLAWVAQVISAHVCEVCGAPGRLRRDAGWYSTRCDEHAGQSA